MPSAASHKKLKSTADPSRALANNDLHRPPDHLSLLIAQEQSPTLMVILYMPRLRARRRPHMHLSAAPSMRWGRPDSSPRRPEGTQRTARSVFIGLASARVLRRARGSQVTAVARVYLSYGKSLAESCPLLSRDREDRGYLLELIVYLRSRPGATSTGAFIWARPRNQRLPNSDHELSVNL